jgi:hypothetical protein
VRINPTWAASIGKQLSEVKEALRARNPEDVARLAGVACTAAPEGVQLTLPFWDRFHVITWPDLAVLEDAHGPCPEPFEAILLQYLLHADGTPLENAWVSLRNLPNGAFYEAAFQGYSGNLIARVFRKDLDGFRAAAGQLRGEPLEMGDAAYRFWALPRIPLALVYWSGGEEFADSAQVLFDKSAGHYHHLEMLAHLGALLCERFVRMREKP